MPAGQAWHEKKRQFEAEKSGEGGGSQISFLFCIFSQQVDGGTASFPQGREPRGTSWNRRNFGTLWWLRAIALCLPSEQQRLLVIPATHVPPHPTHLFDCSELLHLHLISLPSTLLLPHLGDSLHVLLWNNHSHSPFGAQLSPRCN